MNFYAIPVNEKVVIKGKRHKNLGFKKGYYSFDSWWWENRFIIMRAKNQENAILNFKKKFKKRMIKGKEKNGSLTIDQNEKILVLANKKGLAILIRQVLHFRQNLLKPRVSKRKKR